MIKHQIFFFIKKSLKNCLRVHISNTFFCKDKRLQINIITKEFKRIIVFVTPGGIVTKEKKEEILMQIKKGNFVYCVFKR